MSPQPFPHLLPAEAVLWNRFLLLHGAGWERFEYDVRVGRGRPVDPRVMPEVQADWIHLTKQRIDVVGWQGPLPTLFEVTPRARRAALGGIIEYRDLWVEDHPEGPEPALVIVTADVGPDTQRVLEGRGIRVVVVQPSEEG